MKITDIKINPKNPQTFDDLSKLENSIKEFPKMMDLRPIIIDNDNMVIGGNKRFICLQNLGYKDIPDNWIKKATELTAEEKKRFIIADNVGFGDWDLELLESDWNSEDLEDWGLDVLPKELDNTGNYEDEEFYNDPLQLHPEIEYILVLCDKSNIDEAREHFDLGFVKKNNGAKDKIVKNRTVNYNEYINRNTK